MVRFSEIIKKNAGRPVVLPDQPAPVKTDALPDEKPVMTPALTPPEPKSEPPVVTITSKPAERRRSPEHRSDRDSERSIGEVSFTRAIQKPPEVNFAETAIANDDRRGGPHQEVSLAGIIRQQTQEKPLQASRLYQQLVETIQHLLRGNLIPNDLYRMDYSELTKHLDEALNLVITDDRSLSNCSHQYSVEEYLKFHLVNVGIISCYLGKELNYNKSRLLELGILAFLHETDILGNSIPDMSPDREPDNDKPAKNSLLDLQGFLSSGNIILSSLRTGPAGNQNPEPGLTEELMEYAWIIDLVDRYETLCRPKPYRQQMPPQLVIRRLIESGDINKAHLKMLVNLIGVYPVGSIVELNTGEIGRVLKINSQLPLRPVVEIILNNQRQSPHETKSLDLMNHPTIYIKGAIIEKVQSVKQARNQR